MKTKLKKLLISVATLLSVPIVFAQTMQPWMSPEISNAWNSGYKGQGTTITFVDDFTSRNLIAGNQKGFLQIGQHGYWTAQEASMLAPLAALRVQDFSNTNAVQLSPKGLNTINLSYAMYANSGYTTNQIGWSAREQSIINYANNGSAVISKAAGNDYGTAVGSANSSGKMDYLNSALVGSKSAIFVGSLDKNGTTASKANIASYSNVAGANAAVQNKFLVVGVTGGNDSYYKLYGTSFAAPVISGYSAILGSKFTRADATKISNQLLATARTDTIANYNASIHGKGEASIARALAPVSIK